MIIPFPAKGAPSHRIRSDTHGWIVEARSIVQSGTKAGEELWTPVTYHSTFNGALTSLGRLKVRLHPAEGVAAAMLALAEIRSDLTDALSEFETTPTDDSPPTEENTE